MTINDIVGRFTTVPQEVRVAFREHAAEYKVAKDNPRLPRIVGALAESWGSDKRIALRLEGTTIVDVVEES